MSLTPESLVAAIVFIAMFVLISGPVHEAAHAYTAWKLGDGTAKLFGRVTLNPLAHLDPVGAGLLAISVLFFGFGFGWAKPTPVNPYNLRGKHADSIVAAAGPLSNLALAVVFAIAFRIVFPLTYEAYPTDHTLAGLINYILFEGIVLNVLLMLFNLIPIPPLDGSHVLYDFLDWRTARQIRPYLDQYGMFILMALILFGVLSTLFSDIGVPLVNFLAGF